MPGYFTKLAAIRKWAFGKIYRCCDGGEGTCAPATGRDWPIGTRAGIAAWLHFYNEERLHQAHGYRTPRQIYEEQCPWTSGRSAAPNGSASPASRARSGTGEMLTFAPMPTGINNNKDLEIENIAVNLRLAPTPMPSINTAQ